MFIPCYFSGWYHDPSCGAETWGTKDKNGGQLLEAKSFVKRNDNEVCSALILTALKMIWEKK